MQKIISIILIAVLYVSVFVSSLWGGASGTSYNNCGFLYSEIEKYEYRANHARDKYEYRRYIYILNQYKGNFRMYCIKQRYQEPFRNQQDQSEGYLGY